MYGADREYLDFFEQLVLLAIHIFPTAIFSQSIIPLIP